jgi:uroporphyrinogen decarboxylase
MALWGGIDTQLLFKGTPDAVRQEMIRVFGILKPGGGFVCAPDQYFPNMPEENLKALWDTAREYGVY